MDNQHAKAVLRLYRPGTADGTDPELAEALAQVQRDPELRRWFEEHCALQTAVREKLRALQPPAGLKERILAQTNSRRKVIHWKSPVGLAAAAAVLLLLGLSAMWL